MISVALRAEGTNWPLFLHLVFAFLLVGGLITLAIVTVCAARGGPRELLLRTIAFRTSLLLVLPSFVGLYGFGIWLAEKEFGDDEEPDWLEIAFPLTDVLGLFGVIGGTILARWLLRRARGGRSGGWPARIGAALPLLMLVLVGVIVFFMTAKP